jgi:hypothetical protein
VYNRFIMSYICICHVYIYIYNTYTHNYNDVFVPGTTRGILCLVISATIIFFLHLIYWFDLVWFPLVPLHIIVCVSVCVFPWLRPPNAACWQPVPTRLRHHPVYIWNSYGSVRLTFDTAKWQAFTQYRRFKSQYEQNPISFPFPNDVCAYVASRCWHHWCCI